MNNLAYLREQTMGGVMGIGIVKDLHCFRKKKHIDGLDIPRIDRRYQ